MGALKQVRAFTLIIILGLCAYCVPLGVDQTLQLETQKERERPNDIISLMHLEWSSLS